MKEKENFRSFDVQITVNEISQLFSMLRLRPDIGKDSYRCAELQFLQNYIPAGYIKEVAKLLVHFTNSILQSNLEQVDWVNAIPLIHIFSKKVKQFDIPAMALDEIKWSDGVIAISRMKKPAKVAIAR